MSLQPKRSLTVLDETLLRRITVNPEFFGGKPIIRGMRISVELILSLLAQAETPETILTDYRAAFNASRRSSFCFTLRQRQASSLGFATRSLIRYALERKDPHLGQLVRRVEAGEKRIERLHLE